MLCKNVLPLLSEYLDDVLDSDMAVQVAQHLDQCPHCNREFESLSAVRTALGSLKGVQAPKYLHSLVQHRVASIERDSWRLRLQNGLERRWSRIRTTERMWFATKAIGLVMACVFFFVISSSISLYYIDANSPVTPRSTLVPSNYFQQFALIFLSKFGMHPEQGIESEPEQNIKSDAAVSYAVLLDIAQSIPQEGEDYTLFAWTDVDERGSQKMRSVLERPEDKSLLSSFSEKIVAARCRPATRNGQAVPSHLIYLFNTISVYN